MSTQAIKKAWAGTGMLKFSLVACAGPARREIFRSSGCRPVLSLAMRIAPSRLLQQAELQKVQDNVAKLLEDSHCQTRVLSIPQPKSSVPESLQGIPTASRNHFRSGYAPNSQVSESRNRFSRAQAEAALLNMVGLVGRRLPPSRTLRQLSRRRMTCRISSRRLGVEGFSPCRLRGPGSTAVSLSCDTDYCGVRVGRQLQ